MDMELRPCPFCGEQPKINISKVGQRLACWVECINISCACLPRTWNYDSRQQAITAWNTGKNIVDEVKE